MMCGRTACTLCEKDIELSTCQYTLTSRPPKWREKFSWQHYNPSYNISPSQVTPVLVREKFIDSEVMCNDIAIFPMRWGLIPSWYKGTIEKYFLRTNNCRCEGILELPTFKKPLVSGQRCVILANGFYEWKTMKSGIKQPYFIQFSPEREKSECAASVHDVYNNQHLLTMAGIFDIWTSSESEPMYSYSVITMDSSIIIAPIHHRMPAILDGEEEVKMWLDSKNISYAEALARLKPVENLHVYPVSSEVNNSRNNTATCLKEIQLNCDEKLFKKDTSDQRDIRSWLKTASNSKISPTETKKMKLE